MQLLGIVDGRIRAWRHTGVAWRPGMANGESPEMRKVLILFREGSPFEDHVSGFIGTTKTKHA